MERAPPVEERRAADAGAVGVDRLLHPLANVRVRHQPEVRVRAEHQHRAHLARVVIGDVRDAVRGGGGRAEVERIALAALHPNPVGKEPRAIVETHRAATHEQVPEVELAEVAGG